MDVAAGTRAAFCARVSDIAIESPLEAAPPLRAPWQRRADQARDLQPVFSFKIRGAYNRMRQLDAAERGAASSPLGQQHAQGVAMAGGALGIDAVIVMPTTTPAIKVDAVRALGGRAVHGDTFDDAYAHARDRRRRGAGLHPPLRPRRHRRPQDIAACGRAVADRRRVRRRRRWPDRRHRRAHQAVSPETRVIGVEPTTAMRCRRRWPLASGYCRRVAVRRRRRRARWAPSRLHRAPASTR